MTSTPVAGWQPPSPEELQQELPQYEITKMLGRGGMGAVYMGRQTSLDRPVAIKILSGALEESDAGFTERFKNEARAMAKLNHPGIVSVYDFGETASGLLYIVMEYVDGTDVSKMIVASGRLHTEHAMAITAHVCDALSYAHERGIIHRDIKPANIMVAFDGSVKVADFGLAKVSTANGSTLGLTQSGMALGTLHYMAPEALVLGAEVDHRADIYAVGVMFYQMLTGKLPKGMFKMPSQLVQGIDPRFDGVISKAIMEDRDVRYGSVRELRETLDGVLTQPVAKIESPEGPPPAKAVAPQAAQHPGAASRVARRAPAPPPPAQRRFPWAAVFWLLVVAGGGAWWFTHPGTPPPVTGQVPQSQPSTQPPVAIPAPPTPSPAKLPLQESKPESSVAATTTSASTPSSMPVVTDSPAPSTPVAIPQPVFTNTLGMKFVPLPGTRIVMCIHETRRMDYEKFASETPGLDDQWRSTHQNGVPLPQEDLHPVTTISWNGAKAFCEWLSKKEGRKYRLPTDREWSIAVGIADLEDEHATPAELEKINTDIYPWGKEWPPPAGVGNLADESNFDVFHKPYVSGYKDGFATTSPVMSFAPNRLGIYDLAGNLWEFCEDWKSESQEERVLRGCHYSDYKKAYMAASCRADRKPSTKFSCDGFRVVMEDYSSAVASQAPISTAPIAASSMIWIDTKNRSLEAKFVRLEADSVMLDIRGKKTPVPMASLSSASQQIARNLARQAMPDAMRWLLGGWAVFYDPQITGELNRPAGFLSDGTACYSPKQGIYHAAMWKVDNEQLVIEWDKTMKWIFPVPGLRQPEKLVGTIVQRNGQHAIVLAPRGDQGKPRSALPRREDLLGKDYGFFSRAVRLSETRPNMRLETDGSIRLGDAGNESTWEYEDGFLVFRSSDGRPTSIYHKFILRNGRWNCFGPCMQLSDTENILSQK